MTFEEYWQSVIERGLPDRAEIKDASRLAWDAAICSAQAACVDRHVKVRKGSEIMEDLSKLHTWHVEPNQIVPVS